MSTSADQGVKYTRVMLKISGEALMGDQGYGLHPPTVQRIAEEVKSVHDLGVEISMVIGGGNIFRGLQGSAQGMERTTADYMGMLAIQGPQVMQGYWERPEAAASAFADRPDGRWLRTGDVAVIDAEGYISIVDRIKDMIAVGGFKVFPSQVEAAWNWASGRNL